jgi:lysophospholipase L1-like esterase
MRGFLRSASRVSAAVLAGVAVLAGEALLARSRRYLPTSPRLDLDGEVGPSGGEPATLVVLGDSTSAGVGAGGPEFAYVTLVARRVAAETRRRVRLRNLAVSGARVADVLRAQVPLAEHLEPDVALVVIGCNDVTHLTPRRRLRSDMESILGRLRSTGAALVAAGPADMRCTAFLQPLRSVSRWRGRQVRATIDRVARRAGAAVVALEAATSAAIDRDAAGYFSADGFHPGPAGYAVWAETIAPVVGRAVRGRRPGDPRATGRGG